MNYGSVTSGIEAATVAWHPLGWKPQFFSEIAPFPSRLLKYRYPEIPNLGDMNKLLTNKTFLDANFDLLVGGTPCQSFSVAGLRDGLDSANGNLALQFILLLRAKRTAWFDWENVPGVLSSGKNDDGSKCPGKDFAALLSGWTGWDIEAQKFEGAGIIPAKGENDYSVAWRIFDSQYFGVPQRRRRIFVVGHIGTDWRPVAAVLFEQESMRRDFTPRSETKPDIAGTINAGASRSRGSGTNPGMLTVVPTTAATLVSGYGNKSDNGDGNNLIPVNGAFWDGSQTCQTLDAVLHKGQTMPEKNRFPAVIQPMAFQSQATVSQGIQLTDKSPTLGATKTPAILWSIMPQNSGKDYKAKISNVTQPILTNSNQVSNQGMDVIQTGLRVRRLTPLECERLQGFPDDYTKIPGASDSARYESLGNSMTIQVMHYVGRRIDLVNKILKGEL